MVVFSIILPTLNEGAMLSMTVDSIARHGDGLPYEVLVVDDGSTDGSTSSVVGSSVRRVHVLQGGGLGVARARNLGAAQARGEVLVFMDAHCRVSPGWLEGLAALLSYRDIGLVGPSFTKLDATTPRGCGMRWADHTLDPCWFEPQDGVGGYCVPLTTGACQALRRDAFVALGGYDAGFTRWGFEDVEMCLRTWLFGFRVAVEPAVVIAHYFREARDNYDVDDVEITYNFLRMAYLHFSPTRIQRVLRAVQANPHVRAAQERLADSDVFDRRADLLGRRQRDDEWYFREVNGPLVD